MTDKAAEQEEVLNEGSDNIEAQDEQNEEQVEAAVEEQEEEEELTVEEQLQKELNETKDKYLRLVAEFDNFRKRSAKERLETTQTAARGVVQDLLDVLDDTERAKKEMAQDEDPESLRKGAELVFNKFQHILQQKGVKEMDCVGKEFDSDLHEAVTEIPAPDDSMKGKIIDVIQPGYYLNDRLIRHAKVVVGS